MSINATYISATSLSVVGNNTVDYMYGRRLECSCGVDGEKIVTVDTSVWSDPNTVITVIAADSHTLTSNLTTLKLGPGVGEMGSVSPRGLDHDKVLNLTNDGHTQYLRTDGTRPLSADWSAGNARKISVGDLDITTLTSGSIPFIGGGGEVCESNSALYFEVDGSYGKLAVGDSSKMNNTLQSVGEDGITNIDNIKALMAVRNKGTTNNNFAGFSMQTTDSGGNVHSGGRIISKFTSHITDSVSADLIFETRNAGTRLEKMKISSDGKLSLLNGTDINEFSTDTTLGGNSDDAIPTEKAVKTYADTLSSSLQTNIDAKPDTLLELTDTPAAYDTGKYLKSTAAGTEWTAGVSCAQVAYNNITLSGVETVTHSCDTDGKRIVQVTEFAASTQNITNTCLDFDNADEADYIQEDATNGTDFIDDKILLHDSNPDDPVWEEEQKIQGTDTTTDNYFGIAVSIYGDTSIVGAHSEDTGGSGAGAAYIFTRTAGVWTEQQKIQASDKEADDNFGISVSIYADTAIVGASYEDTGGSNTGAAYIFTRTAGVWTEQQKIQASDKEADDNFGRYTAIYDNTVVVGAYKESTGGTNAGAAYIFTRTAGVWTEQQKIQASDKEAGDYFGRNVSIYENTLITGAYHEDTGGSGAGAAYIFTRTAGVWTEQQKIQASDKQINDQFGLRVGVYGDTVLVGAYAASASGITKAGKGYIFTRSGTVWTEQQILTASDKQDNDQLGVNLYMYNDIIVLCAPSEDTGGTSAGAVYIFTRTAGVWTEQRKIQASDIQAGDNFGISAAIYDNTVVVGAYKESTGGTDAGAAYVFLYNTYTDYPTAQPYYVTTSDSNQINMLSVEEINSCTVTNSTPVDTDIKCLVSFDDRVTWEKWGGAVWAEHIGGLANLQTGNTISEFETGFTNLATIGVDYLDFAFDLSTTSTGVSPEIDQITIDYDEAGYYHLTDVSDYSIDHTCETQTRITKLSAGTNNIKVNVLI